MHTITISGFVVPKCSRCGAISIDHEADQQFDAAFRKQVGLLFPAEIQSQREALGLTQQQLADHLRVAVATLSRWETGAQYQLRSLDLSMRSFFKNPGLFHTKEREFGPLPDKCIVVSVSSRNAQ